ncbi:MAG: hypothetical protein IJ776_09075 [Paludibacteraceae bacterium]|nr:hypothetical protein [Paludibacteraceae bacterium]
MDKRFTLNNGNCELGAGACRRNSFHMLPVTDWLHDLPENLNETDLVEVQFKNTRKGYYHNSEHLPLKKGDIVAVEANPGHDIGEVTLTGKLVAKQMQKNHIDLTRYEIRSIYRLATEQDLRKRDDAKAKEQQTMIRARKLAKDLQLQMKIGDVEYQGDGTKAIFYYIADERVDFRQLIKVYAETFRVRIEMKQIGARQEAGRIGGTGPCGRELCCSTWLTNFRSVNTTAPRLQNISLNPQKLAGQCAKLKCCLNFEVPVYEDATRDFPDRRITLETQDGTWYFFSADPLKREITYSSAPGKPANLRTITPELANEIIELNNSGKKPYTLGGKQTSAEAVENLPDYQNVVGQDDLTRFDRKKKSKRPDNRKQFNRDGIRQRDNRDNRPNKNNRDNNHNDEE